MKKKRLFKKIYHSIVEQKAERPKSGWPINNLAVGSRTEQGRIKGSPTKLRPLDVWLNGDFPGYFFNFQRSFPAADYDIMNTTLLDFLEV